MRCIVRIAIRRQDQAARMAASRASGKRACRRAESRRGMYRNLRGAKAGKT